MDAQNLFTPAHIRVGHHHLAVKATRAQQGGIQHIRAVGGRDQDHPLIGLKPIHFHQQLVQGLLPLIIAAAHADAAMATDRINFINKDDAGGIFLGLLKHIAHTAGSYPDEHFDEIGTRNGEEWHASLTRNGTRQQGFPRSRGANQQHSFRNFGAQFLELLRRLKEFHHLLQLLLGLINAGNVVKGHLPMFFGQHAGTATAKAHRLAPAALHLAHKEYPHPDKQQHGEPGQQNANPSATVILGRGGDFDLVTG